MHPGLAFFYFFTSAPASSHLLLTRLLGEGSLWSPACEISRVFVQGAGSTLTAASPWGATAMLPTTLVVWAPEAALTVLKVSQSLLD